MALNSRPRSDSSDSTSSRGANKLRSARTPSRASSALSEKRNLRNSFATSRASRFGTQDEQFVSVRIGDIDREARKYERRERSRLPLIIIGVILAVILACLIAFLILSRTSAFTIDGVEVVGAEHLTTEEISQIISVPEGTTLLNVDTDDIVASLKRDAWIQDVQVKRSFPSTLQLVITEREIAAVVEISVGVNQTIQDWAIASDGMWLMAIPRQDSSVGQSLSEKIYEDAARVLWITDVPYGISPEIGAYCTDDNITNALAIVAGMTTDLADRVKTVSATDAESTLLTLDDGIEIAFGVATDIREKERICLEIIEENPTVVYINVRVVDRPTWRAA